MSQMPDKIWLHKDTKYSTVDEVCGYQYEFAQEIECEGIENFVEYVSTDAFIEKAADKLKQLMYDQHLFEGIMYQDAIIENFVENFKNRIKGV